VGLLPTNDCLRLVNNLLALGQDQLNVARVRHIRVDLKFSQHPISQKRHDAGILTRP
jgi:hypothetical protein